VSIYIILTTLIGTSAAFAYINYKYIKMPFVIGVFFLSTLISLLVFCSKFWFAQPFTDLKTIVQQTDISKFILDIMLGLLLFAGSLHTDWSNVKKQLNQIALFAIGGVILSTVIVALLVYALCSLLNIEIQFIYCLLFGALISPTDPIAVLGILTKANVPKKIESIIVGESLFNDGIGVVIFIALLETLYSGSPSINYSHFGLLFLQEALGGIAFGLAAGFALHMLLKSINHYETEVLLTIAFVMVGYSLCLYFHLSGALAMVVMGLFVGNYKKHIAMSDETQDYVHKFWELIDVILNAILFIIIALVVVVIDFKIKYILLGAACVFIVLLSRVIIVYLPKFFLPETTDLNKKEARIIVWGGLRGGLSIALVLSLPEGEEKNILLIATYTCVVFSILVQGLTIGRLARHLS
jgi:monovalent cation:H+ antiporter, CPA1 family